MFSGIVQDVGVIKDIVQKDGGVLLQIKTAFKAKDVNLGDSISVNGVCLTVIELLDDIISFNVINETLHVTNLSRLKKNDCVNLEQSLKYNDKISGHLVQGHIDDIGMIVDKKNIGTEEVRYKVQVLDKYKKYCVYKGSVAIDGISLTIANIKENIIELAIIPHTLKNTNLHTRNVNDYVNVEVDMMSKYIEKQLRNYKI